jgi:hypothetical protein
MRFWKGALATLIAVAVATVTAFAAATYPTSIRAFPLRSTGDVIQAAFFNDPYDEITAIETDLINGMRLTVKPLTTNLYDLGTVSLLWRSEYLAQTLFGTQGTITASTPFLNLTSTWNAGAVTFQGILLNVTDTASAAASTFLDLQKAGVSQFKVDKNGVVTSVGGFTSILPALDSTYDLGSTANRWRDGYFVTSVRIGTNPATQGYIRLPNTNGVWSRNAANTADLLDVGLNASNQVEVGTGITSGTAVILGGTGGATDLRGTLLFDLDNSQDIGASGANRPRNIYVGSSVTNNGYGTVGGAPALGAFTVAARSTTDVAITVRTVASQTADFLQLQNSATNLIFQFASLASMVNGIGFFPSPTLNDVRLQAQGTDASVGLRIATQGSGILGLYSNSTSNILATFNPVPSSVNYLQFNPSITGNPVTIQSAGTDLNVGLSLLSKGAAGGITLTAGLSANMGFTAGAYQFTGSPVFFRDGNNNTTLQLAQVASAVNAIQISSSAAGGALSLQAVGADSNVALNIATKGLGTMQLGNGGGQALTLLAVSSNVDGVQITPAAAANPATVSIAGIGSDANINLNLISKGTGAVQINGVAPAAAPTITIKKGTGLGNYTTTSTTYVDVDATNLALTVTVPVGQKIMMWASAETNGSVSSEQLFLAIADGTTTLVEQQVNTSGGNNSQNLAWVFTGDGASHTFKLRFRTNTSTFVIINATATELPVMIFWMGVAN